MVVTGAEHETRVEGSDGDPRFLKVIADCVAEEAALLGLLVRPGERSTAPPIVAFKIVCPDADVVLGPVPVAALNGVAPPLLPPPPDDGEDYEWVEEKEDDDGVEKTAEDDEATR
jgi:hypothetical protein